MKVADVAIESIAAGGDGVARSEGIVIFIPRTAPGDRVRAKLDVRKRFARGVIDVVLDPSPDRIEPPCVHYRVDRCGGCQLQHLDDMAWSGFIADRIAGALGQHRLETEIRAPLLSPPKTRRRATLHAERRGRHGPELESRLTRKGGFKAAACASRATSRADR